MGKFVKDIKRGKIGEQLLFDLLNGGGIFVNALDGKSNDLKFTISDKEYFCEVKTDYYCSKSGNIAIEFYNPKSKKPSGINITQADFWVHIIYQDNNPLIYICKIQDLKDFVSITIPHKTIGSGGDDNASLYLYKKESILPIFVLLNSENVKSEIEKLCINLK